MTIEQIIELQSINATKTERLDMITAYELDQAFLDGDISDQTIHELDLLREAGY